MPDLADTFVPNCLNVPPKRYGWHWKQFERARFPSYNRNRSLFGRMLNEIYGEYLKGFNQGVTFDAGIRIGEDNFRREAPAIIGKTYRTAYENTATEFAKGFQQNMKQKQNPFEELFIGQEPDEEEEDDTGQDLTQLALLAVRDYLTASLFQRQRRAVLVMPSDLPAGSPLLEGRVDSEGNIIDDSPIRIQSQPTTLQQQIDKIIPSHARIAKRVLSVSASQELGIPKDEPLPRIDSVNQLNAISAAARRELKNKITPLHSKYFSITETVSASNLGVLAVARARQERTGQQIHKYWLSQRDNRVRETHVTADSLSGPLDNLFRVGNSLLAFPGDWTHGAALEQTINCRCVLIFFNTN